MGTPKKRTPQEKKEAMSLNLQEEQTIQRLRENDAKKKACAAEIDAVLNKFNATIGVDKHSPYGNPAIVVSLK